MEFVYTLKLKFEDLGVIRRAALGLLPNVKDPEGHKPIRLSEYKSSRNYQFIDKMTATLSGGYRLCRSSRKIPTDKKYYWEFHFMDKSPKDSHVRFGIATTSADMEGPVGVDKNGYSVRDSGGSYHEGHRYKKFQKTPQFKIGDVVGFGFVPGEQNISLEMFINGKPIGVIFDDIELNNNWIPSFSIFRGAFVRAYFSKSTFLYDPGPEWSDLSSILPEDDKRLISPKFLINSMKDTLRCSESDQNRYFEAIDAALIPPHQMPI